MVEPKKRNHKINIKRFIKKVVGENKIYFCMGYIKYFKSIRRKKPLIKVYNSAAKMTEIEKKDNHVFCGYFDLAPNSLLNPNEILVHILAKNAIAGKDPIGIGIYNIKEERLTNIVSSRAWSWQMGSRIRWSREKDCIYFNDAQNGHYVCKKFSLHTNSVEKEIPYALYDINADESLGVTINFDRLQRLRPGYGYANYMDATNGVKVPEDDGLFLVDIHNGSSKLIVSYEELDRRTKKYKKGENYLNHISFSPDGTKIMFFYIWQCEDFPGWKATLWVYNIKSNELMCLEEKDQVSHYDWKNNNLLLITGVCKADKRNFYRYYDLKSMRSFDIESPDLRKDGHPVFSRAIDGMFYSDTYPDSSNHQTFFKYCNGKYEKLCTLYHDPRMFREKRCDLHPHYFADREAVALDTTYRGNKRGVLILSIETKEKRENE